ncbi:cyclic GMP-AMP synthase-like receptor isoform X1 [Diorhabda sublineata]|uniref:cyclic GMP-AMP synthase-like receptor isoform X1 n=1 Tax=Diorhabda sublineata TaxID=1163346 RepID=UPI0024E06DB1|nr:cyclic GMP-AMP synthase-like receptor isoform X1 [Diorhabda sublineata]XP_056644113.1 cyclic GMP-AMP synthase-like receptor isoform X1 [Diorhabda sublineata]XP_056644114.1 cyclic GMP-AMP synthase-like receptor isoform X1 [Diorhabda sublineata]
MSKSENNLENVLQKINGKFISLPDNDIKRNNQIIQQLLDLIVTEMEQKNTLFKSLHNRTFYGGSYYDGLRVGQPDEFDLDLLLLLPKKVDIIQKIANVPGYVTLQLDLTNLLKQAELKERYKGIEKLLDDKNYLDNDKVRRWMEGVVVSALNKFQCKNGSYSFNIDMGTLYGNVHKSGPAFTLKIEGIIDNKKINLDIDLVPCFELTKEYWPQSPPFRKNSTSKTNFFIVPKPIKGTGQVNNRNWRLSFQEQERELMKSKAYLKPSIKLLKKLRDTQKLNAIASYYIKTVALSEIEKRETEFWNTSLSTVFMTLLKSFAQMLEKGEINYYWNKKNNLIKAISEQTRSNWSRRLRKIIKDVEGHLVDTPTTIAEYILTPEEYKRFLQVEDDFIKSDLPTSQPLEGNNSQCMIL